MEMPARLPRPAGEGCAPPDSLTPPGGQGIIRTRLRRTKEGPGESSAPERGACERRKETSLDGKINEMLRELQRALADAISESSDVHQSLRRIRGEGYSLYFLVNCKRDSITFQELPRELATAGGGSGEPRFQIDVQDLSFLRSIGIDPTRQMRRRRPSRAV